MSDLDAPCALPCGLTIKNRLAKVAMAESLARLCDGLPNDLHACLYSQWTAFGLVITGNVQVDRNYLSTPGDVYLSGHPLEPEAWRAWASAASSQGSIVLVQLSHCGRQSLRCLLRAPWQRTIAPTALAIAETSLWARVFLGLLFGTPAAATRDQLARVVAQFVQGARLAQQSGFHGVQLHCSHGYFLSAFLSPRSNRRTDEYGGSTANRLRLLFEIIRAIRQELPAPFCLAVKLNAADYVEGGLTEDDALEQVELLAQHGGVDVIEVSGGSYENPTFANVREAFFAAFARRCRRALSGRPGAPLVLVTGGFASRRAIRAVLAEGAADLVGVGRAAVVAPDLAQRVLDATLPDEEAAGPAYRPRGVSWLQTMSPAKVVGFGWSTFWHTMQMLRLAHGKQPDLQAGLMGGLVREALDWGRSAKTA